MKLWSIHGKLVNKNVVRYLIDWDGKSRSKFQFQIKQFIRTYWENDVVFEEFPVFGSLLKVDFYNATKKTAIEVNGDQHDKYNPFFHNHSRINFLAGLKRDCSKYDWLELNKIRLVEIVKEDLENLSALRDKIYGNL